MDLAIVGCGGIGFNLAEGIIRIAMKESDDPVNVWLIDGDKIEERNLSRQFYKKYEGNQKADSLASILNEKFRGPCMHNGLNIRALSYYVVQRGMSMHRSIWLKPGVTIFGCVDNDPTRVLLDEEVSRLKNGTFIVGGNDEWTGQAQMYIRRNGKDATPRITAIAPEILTDKHGVPGEGGCLEDPSPQTATTNRMVALAMEVMFRTSLIVGGTGLPVVNEIRVNAVEGKMTPYIRPGYGRREPCPQKDSARSTSRGKRTRNSTTA